MKSKTKKILPFGFTIGLLSSLGLLNACFSPDLAKARLLCDGVTRFCPESYACVAGLCVNGGAINDSPDLTISVPADLAGADLMPSPDMAINRRYDIPLRIVTKHSSSGRLKPETSQGK